MTIIKHKFLRYLDLFKCKAATAYMSILLVIILLMSSSLIYDCEIPSITYLRNVDATTVLLIE
jgi:hypothetical protein